jgi:hypothetical protein
MPVMGYREYARHRGCALSAVQKAVATKRISVLPCKKIDSAAADLEWEASTNPAKAPMPPQPPVVLPLLDGSSNGSSNEAAAAVPMKRPEWPEWPNWKPALPPKLEAPADNVTGMDTFLAAKTERERAEAEMAKIALLEKQGRLIGADAARQTWRAIGRMFAAAREQVPAQLAAQLVGKTDLNEIEASVRTALREADTRIANEIQARFGEMVTEDRDRGDRRIAG